MSPALILSSFMTYLQVDDVKELGRYSILLIICTIELNDFPC